MKRQCPERSDFGNDAQKEGENARARAGPNVSGSPLLLEAGAPDCVDIETSVSGTPYVC